MNKSLFILDSYIQVLKLMLAENKSFKGYREILATAIGCHRTHISLVLSQKAQLSIEQGYKMAEFWRLNASETEYYLTLIQFERAGHHDLRKFFKQKLDRLRHEHEQITNRISQKEQPSLKESTAYYISWEASAIHMALTIKGIETVEALASHLKLEKSVVAKALELLVEQGFVEKRADKWVVTIKSQHSAKGSSGYILHQKNWRLKATEKLTNPHDESLHYTSLYTLSKKDIPKVREAVLRAIEETRSLVLPSEPEELICFSCDVFKI